MVGKIVSVVNRKGGVGKTTLALGIADTIVSETEKPYKADAPVVVAVDLDPQASLSRALLYDKNDLSQEHLKSVYQEGLTLASYLSDHSRKKTSKKIHDYLKHGVGPIGWHYSMLANNSDAWDVEKLAIKKFGEQSLSDAVGKLLKELAEKYKYVIVDAPPGQTVMAEAAIQVSDLVLCPTTPDLLSFWGLESFDHYLKDIMDEKKAPLARFVFTKFKKKSASYDAQDQVHKWVHEFCEPKNYITLLREGGKKSKVGGDSINVPFDPKLVKRLEGPPSKSRLWPWQKMYSPDTRKAFKRLVSAINRELGYGEPDRSAKYSRTANRANRNRKREASQSA